MKEVAIETKASIEAGEDGGIYWNAFFIPELLTILQVTAMDEKDALKARDSFTKANLH